MKNLDVQVIFKDQIFVFNLKASQFGAFWAELKRPKNMFLRISKETCSLLLVRHFPQSLLQPAGSGRTRAEQLSPSS